MDGCRVTERSETAVIAALRLESEKGVGAVLTLGKRLARICFFVKEDIDENLLSVIEDAEEDSLTVKEEPKEDLLIVKEKADKDLI
ncbi:hypothetical protein KIN20_014350 [Parelaphostrongylus tenuis]|uniref:Uncharacterized protein n=1 Tax=Parelaphostrongylus tenuis TaxID=148309 RepID=A0AAD5MVZ1_PARTN|nr:hypothetical protein KIN20_014350 [Parelaphostrongylus tenuis]